MGGCDAAGDGWDPRRNIGNGSNLCGNVSNPCRNRSDPHRSAGDWLDPQESAGNGSDPCGKWLEMGRSSGKCWKGVGFLQKQLETDRILVESIWKWVVPSGTCWKEVGSLKKCWKRVKFLEKCWKWAKFLWKEARNVLFLEQILETGQIFMESSWKWLSPGRNPGNAAGNGLAPHGNAGIGLFLKEVAENGLDPCRKWLDMGCSSGRCWERVGSLRKAAGNGSVLRERLGMGPHGSEPSFLPLAAFAAPGHGPVPFRDGGDVH